MYATTFMNMPIPVHASRMLRPYASVNTGTNSAAIPVLTKVIEAAEKVHMR